MKEDNPRQGTETALADLVNEHLAAWMKEDKPRQGTEYKEDVNQRE